MPVAADRGDVLARRRSPRPLQPALPPDAFDSDAATVSSPGTWPSSHPEPRPGSDADAALAELVSRRFTAIGGATVSEQRFDGELRRRGRRAAQPDRVLPGQSERQVALIAHRDVAEGSGAATSLASTAALLEIASGFAGSTHEKTLVFVSTDGGSIGALGRPPLRRATTATRTCSTRAIVLSQPAAADPVGAAGGSLVHGPREHRRRAGRDRERDRHRGGRASRPGTRARSAICSGSRSPPRSGSRGRWSRPASTRSASRPRASCRPRPAGDEADEIEPRHPRPLRPRRRCR